jgi:hypothetical protein
MHSDGDRAPASPVEYGFTDFGQIEADIAAMEEFARKLAADVEENYVPHLPGVTSAMLTRMPAPSGTFVELSDFIAAHEVAQDTTQQNVYNFANGTYHFATAARQISADYRGADAFAEAKLRDVDRAFGSALADSPAGDAL